MVISEVEVGAEDGLGLPGLCVTADGRMTSTAPRKSSHPPDRGGCVDHGGGTH